jgi:hypothetical protein
MAAIISEKFRIFNAQQFLRSLGDDYYDDNSLLLQEGPDEELANMYFFIGRAQKWDAYLEIYSETEITFEENDFVYVGTSVETAIFRASVRRVNENSLILSNVGPNTSSIPPIGSTLRGWNGTVNTGAEAKTGVYRYGNEDLPPLPHDNQTEKYDIYDDLVAAKRITSKYARSVIRRYNWNIVVNPKYDMWKPNYSATTDGFQTGNPTATGATSIYDAKFYTINSDYEVFKCLYNGESPAFSTGRSATYEPRTIPAPGQGAYSDGIYKEPLGTAEYIWKYMYTIPTDDVIKFLSTDFMPIAATENASRLSVEAQSVDGAIDVVLIKDFGANLPNGDVYAPVIGDGVGGVVKLIISNGSVTKAEIAERGSGYTYASVPLVTGEGSEETAYGLFTNDTLLTPVTVASNATGALEPIIPPQGGHGSNMEHELNGKRVMLNIRLTYDEGSGDFPVDNDFRRIGIIKNPLDRGTTDIATSNTLTGLYSIKIDNATADYQMDEVIYQTVEGGTAYGTVVSWTLDADSTTSGILKYVQKPEYHTDKGVVRAFEPDQAAPITGELSGASGVVDTALPDGTVILGSTFNDGMAMPEIENNSGELIYIENRRIITRAPDQIEDIKLVIEF